MVSIIIPSRSQTVGLWATIAALEQQDKCEYSVVLSDEPSVSMKRFKDNCPDRVIFSSCGLGPAHSRNIGVEVSHGSILLFMDDHVIVPPSYISQMKENFKFHPGAIFHVPFTSFPNGPVWYEYGEDEKPYRDHPQTFAMPYPVLSGSHGCFAMQRSTWDFMKGYDERFDRYGGEEVYFGLKAKKLGVPVMLDPQLIVMHYSPPVQDTPWKLDYFPKEKELCDALR